MFFRVIKEIKDNPTHFFKNDRKDVALIGKKLNNSKDGNIGIMKNSGEIIRTNKNRNGDLERLQRKQLKNYEKDGTIAGTPAPAATRPNNEVDGEIIKNRTNNKTIPQQTIKKLKQVKRQNNTPSICKNTQTQGKNYIKLTTKLKNKGAKMANETIDTSKLISDYKLIEAAIISENLIFDKAIKYLDSSFNDKTLAPKDKISI